MRSIIALVFILCLTTSLHAQVVQVLMSKTEFKIGEPLHIDIKVASEQDLEITIFTEGHLLLHQNATLIPPSSPFDFLTDEIPAGKYFVLVTGNGIHVEKEFMITK